MLEQIFTQIVDMSKTASIAILVVLIARVFLRKMPKYISYGLWMVVLFRLVCPFSFESIISFIPAMEPTSITKQDDVNNQTTSVGAGETLYQAVEQLVVGEEPIYLKYKAKVDSEGNIIDDTLWYYILSFLLGQYLWLIGIFGMLLYSLYSYFSLKEKLITAIRLKDNIYMVDDIASPFVMGVIRPRIYLPYGLKEEEQRYILLHEQYHIKRFDYLTKTIAYAVLCLHWFNPLVWCAFVQFNKDMEMSCDEAVVKKMGESIRGEYASSLLNMATEDRMIRSTPLAFGEGDTKSRIKNIARMKKASFCKVIVVIIITAVLMLCLAANPKEVDAKLFEAQWDIMRGKSSIENSNTIYMKCDDHGTFSIKGGVLSVIGGSNEYGELGYALHDDSWLEYKDVEIAEQVSHFDYNNETLIYVTQDGKLYGMGNNNFGQLGWEVDPSYVGYPYRTEETCITEPAFIMDDVKYAVLGKSHILILKNDDSLWGIGRNENNELGIGVEKDVRYYWEPQKIMDGVKYIAAAEYNSAAINEKYQLFVWGDNRHGQVARDGKSSNTAMPQKVMSYVKSVYFYINTNGMLHWKANNPPAKDEIYQETEESTQVFVPEYEIVEPTTEEILKRREAALDGLTEQQIKRLKENVKVNNLRFESAYLYKNIFGELEDKNSEYWENFEQADVFIAFYKEVKESTRDEKFKTDIQTLLDTLEMAAKNHDMMQANAIFKILHDMDYFLLRYGIEDVGQYTQNDGMVRKYYGVLAMHDGRISN